MNMKMVCSMLVIGAFLILNSCKKQIDTFVPEPTDTPNIIAIAQTQETIAAGIRQTVTREAAVTLTQIAKSFTPTITASRTNTKTITPTFTITPTSTNTIEIVFEGKWGSGGNQDGNFNHPKGICAVSSIGKIFVADTGNNRVQVFDINGNFIKKWGSFGNGEGNFNAPVDIEVNSNIGRVYVADLDNNRIQIFDYEGNYVGAWGRSRATNLDFNEPKSLWIDENTGLVYLTQFYHNVDIYDSAGNHIRSIGRYLSISYTNQVSVNLSTGKIFISRNGGGGALSICDMSGNFIYNWTYSYCNGMDSDSINARLFVSNTSHYIDIFNETGGLIGQWGGQGNLDGQFQNPGGISLDDISQRIYVLDTDNNRVQVFKISN